MAEELVVSEERWLKAMTELEEWRYSNPGYSNRIKIDDIYRSILLDAEIRSDAKVLDVGCGGGKIRKYLPAAVEYFGIDPFPKSNDSGICYGFAESIPFDSGLFDHVFCFASLCVFRDLKLSFSEMARVIKPSGTLLIFSIIRPTGEPPSKSHTFTITHEIMDILGNYASLKLIDKREIQGIAEIPEGSSCWLYRWEKR